ncbi:hypothetical protein BpHYR1_019791 [Brachionus plicatilis]|uniref:Uncharacterized protein n=1 Tax=Brachionus plicatilis TaxID=10195 RepID=A0A3M7T6W5_BRAPC|nr:hypothetical protein BpHYR1_019791 [Brachionus plicatilis]
MSRDADFDEMYYKCWRVLDENRSQILAQVDNAYVEVDYTFIPAKWTENDKELVIQNWVLASRKIVSTFKKMDDGKYEFVKAELKEAFAEFNGLEN